MARPGMVKCSNTCAIPLSNVSLNGFQSTFLGCVQKGDDLRKLRHVNRNSNMLEILAYLSPVYSRFKFDQILKVRLKLLQSRIEC